MIDLLRISTLYLPYICIAHHYEPSMINNDDYIIIVSNGWLVILNINDD